jgi:DNA-binding IclR family transcriptional regulator
MVDKAAIFAELTERNALRREAKLPLLDLRDEYEHAVSLALWDEAWEQHADELDRIRAEVTAQYGHYQSTAGRMLLGSRFLERASIFPEQYGIYPPTPRHSIRYGEDTKRAAEMRARSEQRAAQHAEELTVRSRIAELLKLRSLA